MSFLQKTKDTNPLDARVKSLQGHGTVARTAIRHALLWVEWRQCLDEANKRPGGEAGAALQRRMVDLGDRMADALTAFRAAVKRAEKADAKGE